MTITRFDSENLQLLRRIAVALEKIAKVLAEQAEDQAEVERWARASAQALKKKETTN